MAIHDDRSQEARERRLQTAFDEAAEGLALELEDDPAASANESVGALIIACVTGQAVNRVEPPATPDAITSGDDDDIRNLVKEWESASPDQVVATFARKGSQPTMALTEKWLGAVDESALEAGLRSEEFARQREQYPFEDPRNTEIQDLSILYIGRTTATATYTLQETYANGKVVAGPSVLIAKKNAAREWKVVLYTKHTHGVNFFEID